MCHGKTNIGHFHAINMQRKMNKYQVVKLRQCIRQSPITRFPLGEKALPKDPDEAVRRSFKLEKRLWHMAQTDMIEFFNAVRAERRVVVVGISKRENK